MALSLSDFEHKLDDYCAHIYLLFSMLQYHASLLTQKLILVKPGPLLLVYCESFCFLCGRVLCFLHANWMVGIAQVSRPPSPHPLKLNTRALLWWMQATLNHFTPHLINPHISAQANRHQDQIPHPHPCIVKKKVPPVNLHAKKVHDQFTQNQKLSQ